jgi:4-alpha-glucanotransferase
MARRGIYQMHVLQYALLGSEGNGLPVAPRHSIASLNTHDMVPFAGFLQSRDADLREEAQLVTPEFAQAEREARAGHRRRLAEGLNDEGLPVFENATDMELHDAAVAHLRAGDAQYVLINLEDCWGETEPQNLPGTPDIPPNWSRKAAKSLEELADLDFGV